MTMKIPHGMTLKSLPSDTGASQSWRTKSCSKLVRIPQCTHCQLLRLPWRKSHVCWLSQAFKKLARYLHYLK